MATRTEVYTYSDLSGVQNASSVEFALQGTTYSIDLTKAEQVELFKLLDPYVSRARKLTGRSRSNTSSSSSRSANPGIYNRVREWARAHGREVADRGRPSKALVEAYEAATGQTLGI
jgi:hypothetical protein